jgi:hypothetical protein
MRATCLKYGRDLKVGDIYLNRGYEWVIDNITPEPDHGKLGRHVVRAHWSGYGKNPCYRTDNILAGLQDGEHWVVVADPVLPPPYLTHLVKIVWGQPDVESDDTARRIIPTAIDAGAYGIANPIRPSGEYHDGDPYFVRITGVRNRKRQMVLMGKVITCMPSELELASASLGQYQPEPGGKIPFTPCSIYNVIGTVSGRTQCRHPN